MICSCTGLDVSSFCLNIGIDFLVWALWGAIWWIWRVVASTYSTSFATYCQCPSITPEMERKVKLLAEYINKFELIVQSISGHTIVILSIYVTFDFRNMHSRQCVCVCEKRKCCVLCILQLIPKLPIRYLNTQHTHECTKPFKKFCHLQRLWQLLSSVSFIVHGRSLCCCMSSYLKGHILISFHL